MPRRRKKTAAKYLVRRVIFILLLLLLLALGGLGLWKLLSPGEEQPSSGSQPEPPSSLSGANIQTGGGEVAPPGEQRPPGAGTARHQQGGLEPGAHQSCPRHREGTGDDL